MQYTVSIAGQSVSVSQLNMVLTIDKTLDYGSFVLRNTQADSYDVGTAVDIDITDGTTTKSYHFIVNADDATKLPNGYYVHSVDIIELTKILEWQTESVRTFTQPVDPSIERLTLFDVLTRLQVTAPIEKTTDIGSTRIFTIDSAIRDRLVNIDSPEFVFNNKNLKEILMEVFDYIGAIPRLTKVSGNITLTADFYNEKGNEVTENEFSRMERFNIDGFSTALDADIKNLYDGLTTIVEPSPNQFKKLSSDAGDLTTDNAVIKTEYPIVEIESIKIKADVIPAGQTIYNNNSLKVAEGIVFDITSQVLEKEEWDDLSNKGISENFSNGDYRDNTLYFERFKNNIGGLYDEVGALSGASIIPGRDKILAVLQRTAVKNNMFYTDGASNPPLRIATMASDFYDIEVQITYKGQFDSRTEVKRFDTNRIKFKSSAYTGQTDNVVRADRVLDRLTKLQQLLGNAEIMTTERVTAVADLHDLSDYTTDDYLVTTVELQCEKQYIIAKYLWNKNYQKVSEFIGLNSDIRSTLFNIPLDSYRRNIYLEDFIEVSDTTEDTDNNINDFGILTFFNTFENSPSSDYNRPINLMSFENENIPELDTENFTIIKPVAKYAGGNSINFHVDFQSSSIAGTRVNKATDEITISSPDDPQEQEEESNKSWFESIWDAVVRNIGITPRVVGGTVVNATSNGSGGSLTSTFGKPISKAVLYTDNLGRIFDAKFELLHSATIENPQIYPLVEKDNLFYKTVVTDNYRIYKDTREELAITYAIQVLPKPELQNTIIIGRYLIEQNNLIKSISTASNQFEVFGTNTPYSVNENRFSRATDIVVPQTYSLNFGQKRLLLSGAVGYTTWGIRKKDTKELVIAVNQEATPITSLYFNTKPRQSGVIYPSQSITPPMLVARPTQIALNPPSNNPTDTTIQIVWVDGNSSPASDLFEVGISSNLRDWDVSEVTPGVTNTITFEDLLPVTDYTIRIRAKIGNDYSEFAYFNATTTIAAPGQPQNVTATIISERRVLIKWDEVADDVFLYRIEASTDSNFGSFISQGVKQTFGNDTSVEYNWLNSGIDYDETYYFRVRALRNGQFGAYSDVVNVTTLESPITSAPTITNVNISGSTISYTLINTDNQLVTLFSDLSAGTTQRATNVRPNEAVQVSQSFGTNDTTIFAKAQAPLKAASQVVSVDFAATNPPSAPSISAVGIVVQPGYNRVNWSYSGELVDGFVVERNPNEFNSAQFGEVSQALPPTARGWTDYGINSGQSYTYRVRAYNRAGDAVSNEVTVTSANATPNAPSSLQLVANLPSQNPGEAFISIEWQRNSTDEDGFLVERKLSTSSTWVQVGGTPKAQTYFEEVISGDENTNYDYRIIAYNEFGNSSPSNILTVNVA